jgi:hypothetical protein
MSTIIKILDEEYIDKDFALKKKYISGRTLRSLKNSIKGQLKHNNRILLPVKKLSSTVQNRIKADLEKQKPEFSSSLDTTPSEIGSNEHTVLLEVSMILDFIRNNSHRVWYFASHYRKFRFSDDELFEHCRTHALVKAMIGFKNQNYSVQTIFQVYRKLHKEMPLKNFNCCSYDYFSSKLKDAEENGIENIIINAKRFSTKARRKFTKVHEELTINYYKNPARFSYPVILKNVNDDAIKLGRAPIHLSRIKEFLRDKDIQNRYKPFRLGKAWAKDNLFPYMDVEKPKLVNSKWEMDSTPINLYVWENEFSEHPQIYILCMAVDVKSRKILGHHIRPTEDAILNEITLFKCVMNTGAFPHQLVHDNHWSYTKSERFIELEKRLGRMNCTITLTRFYEGGDKGTIERTIGLIQSDYLRYTPGWLGFNFGVKTYESKVSTQEIHSFKKGEHKIFLKDLEILVAKYIDQYNRAEIWN